MPDTIALSESAVAVLRFRVKGWRFPVGDRNRDAFQELVAAGIMASDGAADYRFTEDGWARREEVLSAAEAHLRSLEPRLPDRIELSEAARDVLRRRLAGDEEVIDANRDAYRELVKAGIMVPMHTFIGGREAAYTFTQQGWERRFEFQRPRPRFSASAITRSLRRAVALIGKGVSAAR